MRLAICLLGIFSVISAANGEERGFRFTTGQTFLPKMKAIAIVKGGEPGPGQAKHRAVAETNRYEQMVKIGGAGPYDVWWQPVEGLAVKVAGNLLLKEKEVRAIKVDDYLGVVTVRGEGQPRAGLVTIAAQDDPGPDEKGHVAVQAAKDYRLDMAVPPGFYALWISPDNGARPKKVVTRFRVDAGKSITID